MFNRLRIRTKLAVVLAIPMVIIVSIAGLGVTQSMGKSRDARSVAERATAAVGPGDLVTALETERGRSYGFLFSTADREQKIAQIGDARKQVDSSLSELDAMLEGQNRDVASEYDKAKAELNRLSQIRSQVTARTISPADGFSYFTNTIDSLLGARESISRKINDNKLRASIEKLDLTGRGMEAVSSLRDHLYGVFVAGHFLDPSQHTRTIELWADIFRIIREFGGVGTDAEVKQLNSILASPNRQVTLRDVQTALNNSSSPSLGVNAEEWFDQMTKLMDDFRSVPRQTVTEAKAIADSIQQQAVRQERLFLVLAVGAALLGMWLVYSINRSITRPLGQLIDAANEMANRAMPEAVQQILSQPVGEDLELPSLAPIRVESGREVAEVAAALNTVQTAAINLAAEQAVLRRNIADSFVNLRRRMQNLIGRQLDLISGLENEESDPESLANLFRLDHLATRTRRNAESLLVLAGLETPRQWSAPIRMGDVLRASFAEVEEYQRIQLHHVDDVKIVGGAVADLTHLLAELIENALTFSPPDQQVEVVGRETGTGYVIAIIDNGIGMSAADLAQANVRLAGEESFTVAPSRYLGHYVSGRLAKRLGITVELLSSATSGVTAKVTLPSLLLVASSAEESANHAPSTGAEVVVAGRDCSAPDQSAVALNSRDGSPRPMLGNPAPAVSMETKNAASDRAEASSPSAEAAHGAELPLSSATDLIAVERSRPVDRQSNQSEPASPQLKPADDQVLDQPDGNQPGLVRRTRGAQLPVTGGRFADRGEQSAVYERTAADVGSMLSRFRAGVERGMQEGAPDDGE